LKSALSWAAPAVGAAIIAATLSFAGPAGATTACWDSEDGQHCRDFPESAAGKDAVRLAGNPAFFGILKAGEVLTSDPGEWERAQTLAYQWLRDGAVIPGAEGAAYEISASDTGHTLALRVTGSAEGLKDAVVTTLPSPKVSDLNTAVYTGRPGVVISGEVPVVDGFSRVGFTLDVISLGTWSPDRVALQWQADGADIEGANGASYRIRVSDLGKRVTLKVTGSWPGLESVSKSNTAPVVTRGYIHPGNGELYPVGGTKVGDVLGVGPFGWYADGEPMSFLYQWTRDGQPIAGATASTYEIAADDKGHKITVVVTATAVGYGPNPQSSLYVEVDGDTDPTPAPAVPTATASPTVTPSATATAAPAPTRTAVPQSSPSQKDTAGNVVPPRTASGNVEPKASGQALVTGIHFDWVPAAGAAYPVEESEAEAAPPATAPESPAAAPSVTTAPPLALASPGPGAGPSEPAATSASQASVAGSFGPLPLVLMIGGAILAGALIWFARPVSAALVRRRGTRAGR
jgi:hypothetical protein